MTCTYVPSVDIQDEKLQNTCPSGKLLACAGYWTALLLHHGHRNKIMGMGVHKVLLLVVPQTGGPDQGERSGVTIQPYKKSPWYPGQPHLPPHGFIFRHPFGSSHDPPQCLEGFMIV